MGITLEIIETIEKYGIFKVDHQFNLLDIGTSNLYCADPEGIQNFINKHRSTPLPDLEAFAKRLSAGARFDPQTGGLNEAWAGELFEAAGMRYEAIDIAPMYNTRVLDLNFAPCPADMAGRFDLVTNFGTTEHIMNQFNAFKVIHDATRVGGYMIHSVPAIGYVDHGYMTYTARFFFDLASYNNYELVDFMFHLPKVPNDVYLPLRSYVAHFPVLQKRLNEIDTTEDGRTLRDLKLEDIGFTVVYRKTVEKPFLGALEASTASMTPSEGVLHNYSGSGYSGTASEAPPCCDAASSADVAKPVDLPTDLPTDLNAQVAALSAELGHQREQIATLRSEMDLIKRMTAPVRGLRKWLRD